jgi:hypothetical protein
LLDVPADRVETVDTTGAGDAFAVGAGSRARDRILDARGARNGGVLWKRSDALGKLGITGTHRAPTPAVNRRLRRADVQHVPDDSSRPFADVQVVDLAAT